MKWMIDEKYTENQKSSRSSEHPNVLPQAFVESLLDKFGDPQSQQLETMKEIVNLLRDHDDHVEKKITKIQEEYDKKLEDIYESVNELVIFHKKMSWSVVIMVSGIGAIAGIWTLIEKVSN